MNPNYAVTSVYFPDQNTGYAAGYTPNNGQGVILKTTDGGLTWVNDSSGTWNGLTSVFFTDSTTGYVVGNGGTILKMGNGGTDFIEERAPSCSEFTIFPNPASKKITITGLIIPKEEICINIFNINGEKVMNEWFLNQFQVEMDVSKLTPGIYLVKIQTRDEMEVKKLVIE